MLRKMLPVLFFLFACTLSTNAHPLGNFSINNFTRIEVEKGQVRLYCVLDMAEIPTFQESQRIDFDKNGTLDESELQTYLESLTPQFIKNLNLEIGDEVVSLNAESKKISLPMGAGNLPTLMAEWHLTGQFAALDDVVIKRLKFENNNFKERVGWSEIVVNRVAGINVFDSNVFGSSLSDGLKNYPEDMLAAPLAERSAEFSFTAGSAPTGAVLLQNRNGTNSTAVQKDKFAELISVPEITPAIALFGMLLAFVFGAMHAMSPGHGKTVVGAYLVGSRGTVKHAIFLGLTVTITHTLGVFALGLITLLASNYIFPEKVMPFLSFVSGLLVFFIGASLFKDRLFALFGWQSAGHHGHDHGHTHSHDGDVHDHEQDFSHGELTHTHGGSTHTHLPPDNISWGSLLALGISGGLLPCPSALVLMLSAISLGRVGYGLILTLVFSIGLASTLTAVGLVFLYVGKFFGGQRLAGNRIVKMLPVFSAFVIACVGAVICYSSLA